MFCATCNKRISRRAGYAFTGRKYVCNECYKLDRELVQRLGEQLRLPRCPCCHGELGDGLFQCLHCDARHHYSWVREAWRQQDALARIQLKQRFAEIHSALPLIWEGYNRQEMMETGGGLFEMQLDLLTSSSGRATAEQEWVCRDWHWPRPVYICVRKIAETRQRQQHDELTIRFDRERYTRNMLAYLEDRGVCQLLELKLSGPHYRFDVGRLRERFYCNLGDWFYYV